MATGRSIRLSRESFPEPATLDTAVSHALLRRVSDGLEPETIRLHRPGSVVAFGPMDRVAPGFERAVAAARAHGFDAVLRLAGGRAAVFHSETIAFSWAVPDADPRPGIRTRFVEVAELVAAAFRHLGVDARVGEVPGEYCPGDFSVNARGRVKLMGVGQRLVHHAAHVGGVIVVDGSKRIRKVLTDVYDALGLSWDPLTTGALRDENETVTWERAVDAIVERLADRYDLREAPLSPDVLSLARDLQARHEVAVGVGA